MTTHVFDRADHGADLCEHRLVGQPMLNRFADAKVNDLRNGAVVIFGDPHIARLDVAMTDPL